MKNFLKKVLGNWKPIVYIFTLIMLVLFISEKCNSNHAYKFLKKETKILKKDYESSEKKRKNDLKANLAKISDLKESVNRKAEKEKSLKNGLKRLQEENEKYKLKTSKTLKELNSIPDFIKAIENRDHNIIILNKKNDKKDEIIMVISGERDDYKNMFEISQQNYFALDKTVKKYKKYMDYKFAVSRKGRDWIVYGFGACLVRHNGELYSRFGFFVGVNLKKVISLVF